MRMKATQLKARWGAVLRTPLGVGAGGLQDPGHQQESGQERHADADGQRPLGAERFVEDILLVDAEQHDHEQEKDDDGPGVDDHLHGGQEVGALEDEEDRHREQRQHQRQGGVDGFAGHDHPARPGEGGEGEDGEDGPLHQCAPSFLAGRAARSMGAGLDVPAPGEALGSAPSGDRTPKPSSGDQATRPP